MCPFVLLFQPKKPVSKKPMSKARLAETKMQLFGKSCILGLWRERVGWERSSEVHFGKSPCALNQLFVGLCGQLPNYPSINQKMSTSSSFDTHKHPHRRTEPARTPPPKRRSHHPPTIVQPSPPNTVQPSLVKTTPTKTR